MENRSSAFKKNSVEQSLFIRLKKLTIVFEYIIKRDSSSLLLIGIALEIAELLHQLKFYEYCDFDGYSSTERDTARIEIILEMENIVFCTSKSSDFIKMHIPEFTVYERKS